MLFVAPENAEREARQPSRLPRRPPPVWRPPSTTPTIIIVEAISATGRLEVVSLTQATAATWFVSWAQQMRHFRDLESKNDEEDIFLLQNLFYLNFIARVYTEILFIEQSIYCYLKI